ncbi:hypothetical protein Tco_0568216 [Tanacetum coccineum]
MASFDDTKKWDDEHTNSPMITNSKLEIGDEFLKILQDNAFNDMDRGDVADNITKMLEITEWIKIPNEAKDIYEVINRDYSLIPIPAHRNIDNPDDLCKTEEFTIVRHSIGDDEEFITISPSKINTVERTPGRMSCIYHELLNRKDHGWEEQYDDLVETMIWYMLKKTRVELIRAF